MFFLSLFELFYFMYMFDINFRVQELFQDEKRVPRNTNFAITDSWYVHKKAILVKKDLKFVSVQLLFVYNFRYRYMPPTKGCYSSYYIKKPNVVNTYLIRRENMSQQFRFVYIFPTVGVVWLRFCLHRYIYLFTFL